MKIAINITREPLAGITNTNLSLLDHLHGSDISFTGIELNAFRKFKSPIVYRHLSPAWFNHHIISICDFQLNKIVKRSKTLPDFKKQFRPIINNVRDILRNEKPDVVLLNGTYYIPWIISVAAHEEGIPIVLWYAGVLTKEVAYMTPHFQKIFRSLERSIIASANRIIFPSKVCKDAVCSEVACPETVKKGVVIPNPIAPLFTRSPIIEQSVQNRIAFIGRYSPVKNGDGFFDLHKKLLKNGWKHAATMVTEFGKQKPKKLPATMEALPSMSAEELKTFYATQGLIISPSHFETFGNVPIEAVCIGIPVLVNSTMGCSEVLIDAGLENMVVDFNDSEEVMRRTRQLCGQHILPRQVNNIRKTVDTKYVAQKILAVLKKASSSTMSFTKQKSTSKNSKKRGCKTCVVSNTLI